MGAGDGRNVVNHPMIWAKVLTVNYRESSPLTDWLDVHLAYTRVPIFKWPR